MISPETATDIAVMYRDIDAAEKLLDEVKKAIDNFESVDIRDVFGRRRHTLEMGIPSGESSRRILHVPYQLAIPVIEATIASHKARLTALADKARFELSGQPGSLGGPIGGEL
ncbi:MAG: hypothetical protein DI555_06815 [Novosphingobium pentaromativorans]|uniref:Uncharacterized protein n=1 Tax=Novosphingobium pentaromativorans TaxID=205844 RepID=A0A2W5NQD9_9SPHN|nr:MAG: hypothetical protein DI555_06815 [Novosphingobium pentaromativorans]